LLILAGSLAAQQPQYIGAGGCASSNCHGGTSALPENESRILGNEYSIWSVSDRHSRAYKTLTEARSTRMGQILGIADVKSDRRCTSCHAVGSPERARSDGVACEACHGPAEKWLGSHTRPNTHGASVAAGMTETKDLSARAQMCLSCHQGTADRVVDHELIAAGHPDLAFELDTFTWAQPIHHREPKPAAGNSLLRVRQWAVGQAAAFAEGMKLLATRAGRWWPEFAELECYQCHHDLRADSWRIQRGYPGRKPGSLQLNQARLDVLRVLVAQAAPDQRAAVEGGIGQIVSAVSTRLGDSGAVAAAANAAARQGDALVARFEKQDFTPEMARAMVKALAADVPRIAGNGPHSAEQATMTLDALTAAYMGNKLQAAIAGLYDYLEHPSLYQPAEFAAQFRRVAAQAN
jgi:hypothetical protein